MGDAVRTGLLSINRPRVLCGRKRGRVREERVAGIRWEIVEAGQEQMPDG
jgi:hypothetical protein